MVFSRYRHDITEILLKVVIDKKKKKKKKADIKIKLIHKKIKQIMESMLSKYYFNKEDHYELTSLETINVLFSNQRLIGDISTNQQMITWSNYQ
jgi:hypothetical protein